MADEKVSLQPNPDQPPGDPDWGYRLNFDPPPSAIVHEFCGENRIVGAKCPHCEKPLLRILSLNAEDAVLNVDPEKTPMVHLLYCWTCGIPYGEFSYKNNFDGSVTLVKVPPQYDDAFGLDGPYDGYTGEFALRQVSLEPLDQENQEEYRTLWETPGADAVDMGLDISSHQIGGYPFIYNPQRTRCPDCAEDMPLWGHICDDATGNSTNGVKAADSFVDNCGVQMVFHFCRKCSIVSAYHSCD